MIVAIAAFAVGLALVAYTLSTPHEDEPKKIRIKIDDRDDHRRR
jgi:hypothetical protein